MRCRVCNKKLTQSEMVRKDYQTDEYLDTCSECLHHSYDSLTVFSDYDFSFNHYDEKKPLDSD